MTSAFLACRLAALPLARLHGQVPSAGTVVDVGCGHGLVAQYLARLGSARRVIGYDPDARRIAVARAAGRGIPNLEFRLGRFESGTHSDLAAVVVVGVLCLVDDAACVRILSAARASLARDGVLILSDNLADQHDWRYALTAWRERLFARVGFTQGQGLFLRPEAAWRRLLQAAAFTRCEPFRAPVPLHNVFNWVCR